MSKFSRKALVVITLILLAGIVLFPRNAVEGARNGVVICLNVIVPSLLPFFILSRVLLSNGVTEVLWISRIMKPLFNVSGRGAVALFIGAFSGYPLGAKTAADLYNEGHIERSEAERLLAFCNNCSPIFLISAVGAGFLGSPKSGWALFATHIASALLVGMLMKYIYNPVYRGSKRLRGIGHVKRVADLGSIVKESVINTGLVCGFIIMFGCINGLIPDFLPPEYMAVIRGILEISGGTEALAGFGGMKLPLIAAVCAFSGMSVIMQTIAIVKENGLSWIPLIIGKTLHAVIAYAITAIVMGVV